MIGMIIKKILQYSAHLLRNIPLFYSILFLTNIRLGASWFCTSCATAELVSTPSNKIVPVKTTSLHAPKGPLPAQNLPERLSIATSCSFHNLSQSSPSYSNKQPQTPHIPRSFSFFTFPEQLSKANKEILEDTKQQYTALETLVLTKNCNVFRSLAIELQKILPELKNTETSQNIIEQTQEEFITTFPFSLFDTKNQAKILQLFFKKVVSSTLQEKIIQIIEKDPRTIVLQQRLIPSLFIFGKTKEIQEKSLSLLQSSPDNVQKNILLCSFYALLKKSQSGSTRENEIFTLLENFTQADALEILLNALIQACPSNYSSESPENSPRKDSDDQIYNQLFRIFSASIETYITTHSTKQFLTVYKKCLSNISLYANTDQEKIPYKIAQLQRFLNFLTEELPTSKLLKNIRLKLLLELESLIHEVKQQYNRLCISRITQQLRLLKKK